MRRSGAAAVAQVPAPLALRSGRSATCQVFCFPPAGGSPASFGAWAVCAPEDWNLYATPTPGLVGLSGGGDVDWPAAIELITDGITARDDGTPRVFFGHFLGAVTAIAVTGELKRRGLRPPALIGVSACPSKGTKELFAGFDAIADDDLPLSLVRLGVVQPAMLSSTALRATTSRMFRADMRLARDSDHERLLPLDVPLTAFGGERDRLVKPTEMPSWCVKTSNFLGTRIYDAAHAYPSTHATKVVADFAADVRICVQSKRTARQPSADVGGKTGGGVTAGPGAGAGADSGTGADSRTGSNSGPRPVPGPPPNAGQPGPGYSPAGRPVHGRSQRPSGDRRPGR
ncbi:MAG: thioesterase II family protein [Actinocrinis sp.]